MIENKHIRIGRYFWNPLTHFCRNLYEKTRNYEIGRIIICHSGYIFSLKGFDVIIQTNNIWLDAYVLITRKFFNCTSELDLLMFALNLRKGFCFDTLNICFNLMFVLYIRLYRKIQFIHARYVKKKYQ